MPIDVSAPASLCLGLAPLDGALAALALTVQHPPVVLTATAAPQLDVTGACAHLGYAAAQAWQARPGRAAGLTAEVEIELATPLLMGLGSEPMVQLSVANALAELEGVRADAATLARQVGLDDSFAAEVWGFAQGGLLLANLRAPLETPPLRRLALAHPDERAWVIMLYLPKPDDDAPDGLELDRRAALVAAAPHLPPALGSLVQAELWPAAERDDFSAFARALQALHDGNRAALAAAGTPLASLPLAHSVLELLRAEGVPAFGQCLTGLGVWGLIQGAQPSVDVRKRIMALVGHEAGTVMATIADNAGARVQRR